MIKTYIKKICAEIWMRRIFCDGACILFFYLDQIVNKCFISLQCPSSKLNTVNSGNHLDHG